MKPVENNSKTPHTATRIFVAVCELLHTRGSSALSGRAGIRRLLSIGLGSLCALTGAALIASTPALAVKEYVPATPASFGAPGNGAGQLEEPESVAVNDQTGDVYVSDAGNARIDEFDESGATFIRAWGWGVADGITEELQTCTLSCFKGMNGSGVGEFGHPRQIAVDNSLSSSGDVYIADSENNRVEQFSSEGALLSQWTGACEKVGEGAPCAGSQLVPFNEPRGVAVNQEGDVWVYDNSASREDEVYEFNQAGVLLKHFGTTLRVRSIAINAEGGIYASSLLNALLKFDPADATGDPGVRLAPSEDIEEHEVTTVAVDTESGDLVVSESGGSRLSIYGGPFDQPEVKPLQTIEGGALSSTQGLAIGGPNHMLYAAQSSTGEVASLSDVVFSTVMTGSASEIGETTATLHGMVDPEGEEVTTCEFEYGPEAAEPGEYLHKAACAQSTPFSGGEREVTASVTGLEPRHTYHYRLIASNAHGASHGDDTSVFTVSKPLVEEGSTSSVTSDEATVGAQIDAAGLSTSYKVEYGSSPAYGSSSPKMREINLGAPQAGVPVRARLTGLTPGVEYHFRFVATNALGVTDGADTVFVVPAAVGPAAIELPDHRAYERVSSSAAFGELFVPPSQELLGEADQDSTRPFQVAVNGEAIAYIASPSNTGGSGGLGNGNGSQWLATRTRAGWQASDITPRGATLELPEFAAFSSDLSVGIEANTRILAPGGPDPCANLYRYSTGSASYQPLITTTQTPGECGEPAYAGATPSFSQVLISSQAALTPGSEPAEMGKYPRDVYSSDCEQDCNLYDASGGALRQVNVLPDGTQVPNAAFGGSSDYYNPPDLAGDISEDGSRVFWTDMQAIKSGQPNPDMDHVYMRENPNQSESPHGAHGECTVAADACTIPVSDGSAKYWGATPDGRYVYYVEAGELWRFDTETDARDLLIDEGVDKEAAGVQGVLGINQTGEDGSYVYVVAEAALAAGDHPLVCRTAAEEEPDMLAGPKLQEEQEELAGFLPLGRGCNLYLLHGGEAPKLIAVLSPSDDHQEHATQADYETRAGDWAPDLGSRTSQMTPDGKTLLFESRRSLTGYDNRVGVKGEDEAYLYSAGENRLDCVSCDPTGAPPPEPDSQRRSLSALPISLSATHIRRFVSSDGDRVFFTSFEGLVPQDSNGAQDVYEWERPDPSEPNDTCTPDDASPVIGGCVSLLSGGEISDYSFLVESDPEGNNVFIVTRAQFVPQDKDEKMDLYDVRVDGGFPESALTCTGTGCQGVPPAPPSFATPASATFSGAGNFAPAPAAAKAKSAAQLRAAQLTRALEGCRTKHNKRKRKECEAQERRRYGPPPHKAKSTKRGGHTKSSKKASKGTLR